MLMRSCISFQCMSVPYVELVYLENLMKSPNKSFHSRIATAHFSYGIRILVHIRGPVANATCVASLLLTDFMISYAINFSSLQFFFEKKIPFLITSPSGRFTTVRSFSGSKNSGSRLGTNVMSE